MHEKTKQTLALVAAGVTPYRAAKLMGIALSTIYRAIAQTKKLATNPAIENCVDQQIAVAGELATNPAVENCVDQQIAVARDNAFRLTKESASILKHLFLRPEILSRLIFKTENGDFYIQATNSQKRRRALPEEIIRQLFVLSLIHDYKIPEAQIHLEFPIQMGISKKRADVVVVDAVRNPKIIIEVKVTISEDSMLQLKSYMSITGASYGALVSSTEVIYIARFPTGRFVFINDLPIFAESDDLTAPKVLLDVNFQNKESVAPVAAIEIEDFVRNTPTRSKITIKGHMIERPNDQLESYKKLRQAFLGAGVALNPDVSQREWAIKFFNLLTNTPVASIEERTLGHLEQDVVGIQQEIKKAIEADRPGFRHGWVSSAAVSSLLESLRMRIAPINMRGIMQSLGYDWHPGLPQGRCRNPVPPDNAKPKLFICKNHACAGLEGVQVERAYSAAQIFTSSEIDLGINDETKLQDS